MRYLSIFILTFCVLTTFASIKPTDDILAIKQAMILAVENAKITDSLYSELSNREAPSPLIIAYTGTLEALKAKHSWNPYQKVSYVARSQKTLQKAVNADPANLEIRFMRFSIQHYTPAFLGYSKELNEDRRMIVKQYSQKKFANADQELIKNIATFMISSNRCTSKEIEILRKYS